MYRVCVRDHVMIAHSLPGETFGPAQGLHGATYVVDAAFAREELDDDGIVIDIGRLTQTLREVLATINYRNLDEMDLFEGRVTTTEVVARWIFDQLARALRDGELGESARGVSQLCVTLHESHVAWAAYEGDPHEPAA